MTNTTHVSRAIQATLSPLMGTVARGSMLVHSLGATGTVPFGSMAIPVIRGGLLEEATAFVSKNPATADGSWPVTQAGTPVAVESLEGGTVGNTPAGTQYRWDEPLAGIEDVSDSPGGVVGGVESQAFGALKQLVLYKKLDQVSFEQFLRAQLSQYPGAILAWESSMPLDGPMAATPGSRTARMGTGKFLFKHTWMLWVVTARLDTEGMRRREGDTLRDDILETLFDCASARGLRVAVEPGIEIISANVFGVTPTSYVDLIRFATPVALKHRPQGSTYNDWLRTRLRQTTAAQGASPPIALPDVTDPMPPNGS